VHKKYSATNLIIVGEGTRSSLISILLHVLAVRCEKFQDGSSVLILNKTSQCEETSECLGEKEINVSRNVTECSLSSKQAAEYLHKDEWETLSVETDSFDVVTSENNVSLKVLRSMISQ
jgi:hypothetical protein